MKYYKISLYPETEECHLFEGILKSIGIIVYKRSPICNGNFSDLSMFRLIKKDLTENEMARFCSDKTTNTRHQICANCVKYFYKTDEE